MTVLRLYLIVVAGTEAEFLRRNPGWVKGVPVVRAQTAFGPTFEIGGIEAYLSRTAAKQAIDQHGKNFGQAKFEVVEFVRA